MSTPTLSTADRRAHRLASHVRMTPEVQRAVVRFENASERFEELSAMDARHMSPAQYDALTDAQKTMAASRAALADAGQLHLIEVDA